MFKTSNSDNTNQANSVYDAAGQRVATQVAGAWTHFVYDAFGKLVSEYGGLSSTAPAGVKYVLQDWQGSTRAIVGNTGVVQSRMDYTAFGEEINSGVGQRTTQQGFGANNNLNQKYALTERDKATGLDHTWFRKNENRAGRWTSPDPYNGSMSLGNPQSFNRYSYVENQPTNFIDPTGLLLEGDACQINGQVDTGGNPVYQGTVRNGRCQSHAGTEVQIFGWGLAWGWLGGGGLTGIPTPGGGAPFISGGGGGYEHPVDQIINNSKGRAILQPVQPLPDPCGTTTDIGASTGIYNYGFQIGKHALYFYGGLGGGFPRFAGNLSTSASSPSEGKFIVGNGGVAIGGSRSLQVNSFLQGAGEFFNPNSNNATASYGAMSPQVSLSYQKNVRIYNFGGGDPACQK